MVDQLERLHGLINTVHTRASTSPTIDTWHTAFHKMADAMFADDIRATGAAETDLPAITAIGAFVIEGLLTHNRDDAGKRAVIDLLVRSLTTASTPAGTD